MHGTKHTTEFDIYDFRQILDVVSSIYQKASAPIALKCLYTYAQVIIIFHVC